MSELIQDLTLQQLLDANGRFALNGKGTTNHCPMALCALAAMGTPPARLHEFFAQWERRFALPEASPGLRIARESWPAYISQADAFAALRLCFQEWMMEDGPDAVIGQVFSRLPFAPASGAFHAVIRLAYGLEAMHDGEIAAGLAALVSGNLPIEIAVDEHRVAASVGAGLASLSAALHGADPWPQLFRLALSSNDDHDIKTVYTCYCENLRAPSLLYSAAAARRVRHLG